MNARLDVMSMKHLSVLDATERGGEAVADSRLRLDADQFRAAVAGAAGRFAAAGIGLGDVVATVLTNRVELVVALYAAWDLGAVLTPVNPASTPDEIAYQLSDGAARLAVVEAGTADKVAIDSIDAATLLDSAGRAVRHRRARPDELALLIYTSGTTGRPKGVMLDHANVEAMTLMLLERNEFTAADRALLILPLFHVNAIMLSVVTPLAVGASTYIANRFDADAFWPVVEVERATYFSGVPAVYLFLTELPDDVRPDVSALRFAICGAAPMPVDAVVAFEDRYGIPIVEGYGLSESTVALTGNPIDDRRPGTVGRPLDGLEVAVVDDKGVPVPPGTDGEIVARGPNIMRGYLNRPKETADALKDRWLHTGDIGHLDADGYLVLVDRKKDLIIRGGENISPSEVEAVLQAHPAVAQAAVVGQASRALGEEPVAFVVAAPGHAVDGADIIAHCRTVLAPFKVPLSIYEIDELPRNAVGKVTKDVLRRRLTDVRREHR